MDRVQDLPLWKMYIVLPCENVSIASVVFKRPIDIRNAIHLVLISYKRSCTVYMLHGQRTLRKKHLGTIA